MSHGRHGMRKSTRLLAKNIQALRERVGWSQAELARRMQVPAGSLTEWLNETVTPKLDKIELMADAFGISIAELMSGDQSAIRPLPPHTLDDCLEAVTKAAKGQLSIIQPSLIIPPDIAKAFENLTAERQQSAWNGLRVLLGIDEPARSVAKKKKDVG